MRPGVVDHGRVDGDHRAAHGDTTSNTAFADSRLPSSPNCSTAARP